MPRYSRRSLLVLVATALMAALTPFTTRAAQFDFPTSFGDNLALTSIVLGFVMGPVIDFINRRDWSSELKAIGAFFWCLIASILLAYVMGQTTTEDWLRTFLIVFVSAIALHRLYWKPSGISDVIDRASG